MYLIDGHYGLKRLILQLTSLCQITLKANVIVLENDNLWTKTCVPADLYNFIYKQFQRTWSWSVRVGGQAVKVFTQLDVRELTYDVLYLVI